MSTTTVTTDSSPPSEPREEVCAEVTEAELEAVLVCITQAKTRKVKGSTLDLAEGLVEKLQRNLPPAA